MSAQIFFSCVKEDEKAEKPGYNGIVRCSVFIVNTEFPDHENRRTNEPPSSPKRRGVAFWEETNAVRAEKQTKISR